MVKQTTVEFTLLNEKKTWQRLDVLPFVFIHAVVFYWWFEAPENDDVYPRLAVIVAAFLNSIAYLLGHWSQRMRARISYNSLGTKKTEEALN